MNTNNKKHKALGKQSICVIATVFYMFLPTTSIFNDLPWGLMYQCVAEMCIYAAVPSGNHQMKTTPSIGYNTVVYVLKKL